MAARDVNEKYYSYSYPYLSAEMFGKIVAGWKKLPKISDGLHVQPEVWGNWVIEAFPDIPPENFEDLRTNATLILEQFMILARQFNMPKTPAVGTPPILSFRHFVFSTAFGFVCFSTGGKPTEDDIVAAQFYCMDHNCNNQISLQDLYDGSFNTAVMSMFFFFFFFFFFFKKKFLN